LRAEAAVAKAGIKMLFPIVALILPVLFVITLVPGMLSALKDLKLSRYPERPSVSKADKGPGTVGDPAERRPGARTGQTG